MPTQTGFAGLWWGVCPRAQARALSLPLGLPLSVQPRFPRPAEPPLVYAFCMDRDKPHALVQIRVTPELRDRFKVVCAKQSRSMSSVLSEFVGWYTKKKEAAE